MKFTEIKVGTSSLLFLLLFSLGSQVAANTITVITPVLEPYVFPGGKKGISIELADALFKKANLNYQVKIQPLARALIEARDNPYHCVMPVQRSQERETLYQWVTPIQITQTAFFARTDSAIELSVLNDARQYQIGVNRGSATHTYLEGFNFDVQLANTATNNLLKLDAKRMELWAGDTLNGPYYAKKANVQIKELLVFSTALRGLACHIDMEQKQIDQLKQGLKELYQDGTVEKIRAKYASQ